jgi:hypothetical protein
VKLKDAVVWQQFWATALANQDNKAVVEDGMLIENRVCAGTKNITLIVQCADGKYYGTIRVSRREVYPCVLEFPGRNRGRKLQDIMEKDIVFAETVH